jgi:hypothetical protein
MRKVVVTLEILPYTARAGHLADYLWAAINKELDYESGEHVVSIEVEDHPEDDFGEEKE